LRKIKEEEAARQNKHHEALMKAGEERVQQEEKWVQLRKDQVRNAREEQIRRKAEEQERQQYEDVIMSQEWARRTETMQQAAIEKDRRIIMKNLETAEYLKQQAAETRAKKRLSRLQDLEAARITHTQMEEADREYLQYAHENIHDFAAKGRTIVPMKLTLRKQEARKIKLVVE
jgi:hypothetical protein